MWIIYVLLNFPYCKTLLFTNLTRASGTIASTGPCLSIIQIHNEHKKRTEIGRSYGDLHHNSKICGVCANSWNVILLHLPRIIYMLIDGDCCCRQLWSFSEHVGGTIQLGRWNSSRAVSRQNRSRWGRHQETPRRCDDRVSTEGRSQKQRLPCLQILFSIASF